MPQSAIDVATRYPSTGRLRLLPRMPRHIMIIDDDARYPQLLLANLNILHNYASEISLRTSLGKALEDLRSRGTDLLFTADALRPCVTFGQIRRYVEQAGYCGPIIACVKDCTNETRRRLLENGATCVLERGETHTASLISVIKKTFTGDTYLATVGR